MRGTGITAPVLRRLYTNLGKTDSEIASFFGVDRTTIVHLRKKHGINSRKTVGDVGEEMALKELKSRGYKAVNMNDNDKLHSFDLLVEEYFRVEVKTSSIGEDGYFNFVLTEKAENKNIESENRIRLSNGRTKKLYRKTCDLLMLVGLEPDGDCHFFLIRPDKISDHIQSIKIPFNPFSKSKYAPYRERWVELEEIKRPDAPTSDQKFVR